MLLIKVVGCGLSPFTCGHICFCPFHLTVPYEPQYSLFSTAPHQTYVQFFPHTASSECPPYQAMQPMDAWVGWALFPWLQCLVCKYLLIPCVFDEITDAAIDVGIKDWSRNHYLYGIDKR